MTKIKAFLIFSALLFSFIGYSQTIKHYKSDYCIKVTTDISQSPDKGSVNGIRKDNVSIIHNTTNSTIEFKFTDDNKRIFFFRDVKYRETFTNNGNKYIAYSGNEKGVQYFISFGNNLIKVDNRENYKT